MAKLFYMLYNSVVLAFLLSFISFRNVWLEMRVNIGLLIPVYAALCFAVFFAALKNTAGPPRRFKLFTALNLAASSALSVLILGIKSVPVVPAAIVREALGLTRLKFLHVNAVLAASLAAGLLIILFQRVDYEK